MRAARQRILAHRRRKALSRAIHRAQYASREIGKLRRDAAREGKIFRIAIQTPKYLRRHKLTILKALGLR